MRVASYPLIDTTRRTSIQLALTLRRRNGRDQPGDVAAFLSVPAVRPFLGELPHGHDYPDLASQRRDDGRENLLGGWFSGHRDTTVMVMP